MRSQTVILTAALTSIIGSSMLLLIKLAPEFKKYTPPNPPDMYMAKVQEKQMDGSGAIKSLIKSKNWEYYKDKKESYLSSPHIKYYKPCDAPWNMTAKSAVIEDKEVIYMQGDVKMHQPSNNHRTETTITTSEVTVYPQKKYAITHKPVNLKQQGMSMRSIGAKFFYKENKLELLSHARGQYDPNKATTHPLTLP